MDSLVFVLTNPISFSIVTKLTDARHSPTPNVCRNRKPQIYLNVSAMTKMIRNLHSPCNTPTTWPSIMRFQSFYECKTVLVSIWFWKLLDWLIDVLISVQAKCPDGYCADSSAICVANVKSDYTLEYECKCPGTNYTLSDKDHTCQSKQNGFCFVFSQTLINSRYLWWLLQTWPVFLGPRLEASLSLWIRICWRHLWGEI